ncbi:Chaperonin Cpn60/TCP-1 [Corchorus olitorius]|uniref:Chaperonin Cpn60/TCP-1 n=1 Tax=Corchorus olitorius TaxID=93759 RepID=A0A1R3FVJ3_9ROSI|nr:Chaperonin Cpn60/TCP-1 [Corchorus olitorius]
MAIAAQAPDILGERQSGQDICTQNVLACQVVANIVKSSLGPVRLDKDCFTIPVSIMPSGSAFNTSGSLR